MKKNKLMLSSVVLLVLLSAVGYGYAHWADSITYTAEVQTGSMTLVHMKEWSAGTPDGEAYSNIVWGGDKNDPHQIGTYCFGSWGFKDLKEDCITKDWGWETMWVKFENVYPGIRAARSVVLENIGTTPLHITGVEIWDPSGEMTWVWVTKFSDAATYADGFFYIDGLVDDNGKYDPEEAVMYVTIGHGFEVQLHTKDWVKSEVDIDFLQPLEECGKLYEFEIKYLADQWNWEGVVSDPPV